MSHGPDGRPQIYQATSSTKTGPGGVRETQKTVQDSRSGLKKMAIGHHIGERAHIIEREQNMRSGQREERQDFINLDEGNKTIQYISYHTKTKNMCPNIVYLTIVYYPQMMPKNSIGNSHKEADRACAFQMQSLKYLEVVHGVHHQQSCLLKIFQGKPLRTFGNNCHPIQNRRNCIL